MNAIVISPGGTPVTSAGLYSTIQGVRNRQKSVRNVTQTIYLTVVSALSKQLLQIMIGIRARSKEWRRILREERGKRRGESGAIFGNYRGPSCEPSSQFLPRKCTFIAS
jgi:hypothetical protein